MNEIVFQIEEDPDGGYTARAVGASIFTEADDLDGLRANIRQAVLCHFGDAPECPKVARLHFIRDEVMTL